MTPCTDFFRVEYCPSVCGVPLRIHVCCTYLYLLLLFVLVLVRKITVMFDRILPRCPKIVRHFLVAWKPDDEKKK